MPLLEAVEHAALRAGVPVDARIESGRTPIHALKRLWDAERFDRIVVPAPAGREPGFTPKDLTWMLTHAPSETLILRPSRRRPRHRRATLRSAPQACKSCAVPFGRVDGVAEGMTLSDSQTRLTRVWSV